MKVIICGRLMDKYTPTLPLFPVIHCRFFCYSCSCPCPDPCPQQQVRRRCVRSLLFVTLQHLSPTILCLVHVCLPQARMQTVGPGLVIRALYDCWTSAFRGRYDAPWFRYGCVHRPNDGEDDYRWPRGRSECCCKLQDLSSVERCNY